MGYTLTIGQLETALEADGLYTYLRHDAVGVNMPDAPAYGEPTDNSNSRWPSYTSWDEAMKFVGLHDLFYNKETGLLREHPGCFPLIAEHKAIIDAAHEAYYIRYPNAKAGYSPKINEENEVFEDPDWPAENSMATRLEWLKYWVDWALSNCSEPVFVNS